jgi:hypothetical protein
MHAAEEDVRLKFLEPGQEGAHSPSHFCEGVLNGDRLRADHFADHEALGGEHLQDPRQGACIQAIALAEPQDLVEAECFVA